MPGVDAVRLLAHQASWRRWAVGAVLGRLLSTMVVLAYVLVGESVYGSISFGALLAGAATFSAGLAAPWLGRLFDRRGIRRGLVLSLTITTAVLGVQTLLVSAAADPAVLVVLAIAHGISYSAVPGGYRALLVPSVSERDLPRANTLDAVLTEVGFVAGPAVAGMVAAVGGVIAMMATMTAIVGLAALSTVRLPAGVTTASAAARPWRAAHARVVYAICLAIGAAVGIFESALAARAVDVGYSAALAGPLLAVVAVGSGLAGFAVSTLDDQRGRRGLRAAAALGMMGLALLLASTADGIVVLVVAAFCIGVPIAPLNAMGSQMLQDTLSVGQLGEGFAVYTALILIGVGLGDLVTAASLDGLGSGALVAAAGVIPLLVLSALAIAAAPRHAARLSR